MSHCDWSNLTSAEESNMYHVTPLALHRYLSGKGAFLSRAMWLVLWMPKAVLPTFHKIDTGSSDENAWLSLALQEQFCGWMGADAPLYQTGCCHSNAAVWVWCMTVQISFIFFVNCTILSLSVSVFRCACSSPMKKAALFSCNSIIIACSECRNGTIAAPVWPHNNNLLRNNISETFEYSLI